MRKLRISAISFLNTAPLMWDFERGERARELAQEFEISYTVPSLCAEALRTGEADIGIIPAITYQTIPDLSLIPSVAIAARGAVRSILLVSKVPVENIHSVAVDTSSRTSVALLEILFRKGWLLPSQKAQAHTQNPDLASDRKSENANQKPETSTFPCPKFVPCNPGLKTMLAAHDAALLIGDFALRVDRSRYEVIDLAQAWREATGKPFVFAFWAVRDEALAEYGNPPGLCSIFQQSRDHGLAHIPDIARQWAPRLGIAQAEAEAYLRSSICYSLDRECWEGLGLFFLEARKLKIIPALKAPRFISSKVQSFGAENIHFLGEQDGASERELKTALAEFLSPRLEVAAAYLARVSYDEPQSPSVALCLRCSAPSQEIVHGVQVIFHPRFNANTHLDILFLSSEQESRLAKVCRPFFIAASAAKA